MVSAEVRECYCTEYNNAKISTCICFVRTYQLSPRTEEYGR